MIADNLRSELGITVEPATELSEEIPFKPVGVGRGVEGLVVDLFDLVGECRLQGLGTARTEALGPAQRRPTLRALLEFRRTATVVGVGEAVVLKDRVVHLLVRDPGVRTHFAGILVPVDAVFDLLVGEAAADPLGDCRPAEEVGMDPIRIEARLLGNQADALTGVLLAQRSIAILVDLAGLVDDRPPGIVRSGVDIQPVGEIASAPSQRLRAISVLDVGVGVDRDRRSLAVDVDMLELQREDGTDPQTRVSEQGDQRLVPGSTVELAAGLEHRPEFLAGDLLVGVVLAVNRRADRDFVGEVRPTPLEELPDGLHIVADRALGEVVLVFEMELQRGDIVESLHLDERAIGALGGQSDAVEVADDRAQRLDIAVVRSEVCDPALDRFAIGVADLVAVLEELALVAELLAIALDVVDRDHDITDKVCGDYVDWDSNPPGTTKNYYIIHQPERPCWSGDLTSRTPGSAPKDLATYGVSGGVGA